MNKEETYLVWAPEERVWSRWAKPVLFAYVTDNTPSLSDTDPGSFGESVPAASASTGLVLDLDGPRGVFLGIRIARKGYCLVPLYNACPQPKLPPSSESPFKKKWRTVWERINPQHYEPVVDVAPLLAALVASTDALRRLELPWYAPPAFLLDSRRRGQGKKVDVGMFDNRSVIFPSDFPSAEFLKERGITNIIVILETGMPQFDLAAVLREWQAAGIGIKSQVAGLSWSPMPLALPRPSWIQTAWFWIQSHLGLQRKPSGGYGTIRHGGG